LPLATPFTLHVTAMFDVPETVAVKFSVCEALSVAVVGLIVTVTLLVLEFPPPHPVRNTVEIISSATAPQITDRQENLFCAGRVLN